MSFYRMGFCPQCQTQILVKDTNGKWSTVKPSYAQIDLEFADGQRVRSAICKKCLTAPDYEKLFEAITHKDSQACNAKIKDLILFKTVHSEVDKSYEIEIKDQNGETKKFVGVKKEPQITKIERTAFVSHQAKG